MRRIVTRLAGAAMATAVGAAVSVTAAPLLAGANVPRGPAGAVFVQTDNTNGNQIAVYDRAPTGALGLRSLNSTGGSGGVLNGSAVDHLASQGSLVYDAENDLLYAVNAGSNTVSVFGVFGDRISLRQVVSSGGTFPVSIAAHGNLVYVLNALGGGAVTGYRVDNGFLRAIRGSTRTLGLSIPATTGQFTHTPGQVSFTPSGSQLLVTTKASSNSVDVFGVGPNGLLSWAPVVNFIGATTVPFALTFDGFGRVVLTEAGPNAIASFALTRNGRLIEVAQVATGGSATCWVAQADGTFFTSNAASATVTGISETWRGTLSVIGSTTTAPGTVDATTTPTGRYLYVQTGLDGIVDEFAVGNSGALALIGTALVPDAAGGEGIAAD
jgi:6-phosphogluconolactonase (cycloisomerase 2 family)